MIKNQEVKALIEVENIVKTYGDRVAVDHLSFKLEKGKIYGFLGPNGAGKSTTMNIMTGYIAATSGTVKINNFDILRQPEQAKACIGYLPEMPPLYTDMTVMEYLQFVAELKKVPKKDRRDQIAKILKMTMLGDYGQRMIRNLSKGYRQRVGLAQALIGFPEVIILDEPTVGLDPQQIMEIRSLIRSLRDDHIVILSSHILAEVSEVCDQVMIISHGKMVANGAPSELEMQASKTVTIRMSILGDEAAIRGAVAGIDHVKTIEIGEKADADGALAVTIETDSADDIRADIAKSLAVAGLPVLSMVKEEKSLEDVFLEVTTETPGTVDKKKKKKAADAAQAALQQDAEYQHEVTPDAAGTTSEAPQSDDSAAEQKSGSEEEK